MLRVGLTGDLGSGKSTVARMLAERGAVTLSADEIGRAMMQPGEPVYQQIVEHFGSEVVQPDGTLNRSVLAHLAFNPEHPRIEELNAIVHPAVIAEQAKQAAVIAQKQPNAILVVESALIFSTRHAPGGDWHSRFDCIVVVTAPDEQRVARFVARMSKGRKISHPERAALEAEARRRTAHQRVPSTSPGAESTLFVLPNRGSLSELEAAVDALWPKLLALRPARMV
jgi:dephospho-CoA kinase